MKRAFIIILTVIVLVIVIGIVCLRTRLGQGILLNGAVHGAFDIDALRENVIPWDHDAINVVKSTALADPAFLKELFGYTEDLPPSTNTSTYTYLPESVLTNIQTHATTNAEKTVSLDIRADAKNLMMTSTSTPAYPRVNAHVTFTVTRHQGNPAFIFLPAPYEVQVLNWDIKR